MSFGICKFTFRTISKHFISEWGVGGGWPQKDKICLSFLYLFYDPACLMELLAARCGKIVADP